jgi:hypothetical protein
LEGAISLLRRNQFAKRILKFNLMSAKEVLYDKEKHGVHNS